MKSTKKSNVVETGPLVVGLVAGLVEYGTDPLPPSQPPYPTNDYGYESASSQRRRRRSRGRGADDHSPSGSDTGKKRSRSRIRDMAAAAVGTGAAAIGIKEYKKKKDAEKEREDEAARRARERSLSRDYSRDRSRRRDEGRRRYEEESNSNPHYDDYSRPPSPPHASGGAYYPTPTGSGFSQNQSVNDPYPPYSPHAYTGFPPPQPGGPPTASGAAGGFPTPTPGGPPLSYQGGPPPIGGGPPPAGGRLGPDHVSDDTFHTTTPKDSVSRNAAPPIATREGAWFEGAVASATRKTVGVNFIVPGSDEVCGRNVYGCVHICYEIRHMGSLVA
ncbi:hypothetical protein BN1708_014300 [Verticillium longisporum]|uniref:DUF3824 domain-containing protein n=1 Tax=Verticillium longisporum TaxID=100787 RepID=A0A0G4LUP4_VERLO|nr:hypothetical protein BN1708_014300 [Verticillium longisporum]